jgi:hypothetical protein
MVRPIVRMADRRTARVLLVLAGLTVLAVIALGVVVLIAWGTQRDS